MQATPFHRLKRSLRSPAIIVAEIVVIMLAGVAGTLLPQGSQVFRSGWFLGTVALAFASLLIVVMDQCRNLCRTRPRQFAPYGGLLIHVGLLLVIFAAALNALFGAQAVVDVMEGETLPPTSAAWAFQKPGAWVGPIRVNDSVMLESVDARRYPSGDLQNLTVRLSLAGANEGVPRREVIPVNQSVESSGVRLFVGSDYGPASLVEWSGPSAKTVRTAVLLKHESGTRFEGELAGPDGERAYLRAEVNPNGNRPARVEVRVMKESSLLFAGVVRIDEPLRLPSGGSLIVRGIPFWVRLHASRDPALWVIYLGFALVILGVTVRFAFLSGPRVEHGPVRASIPLTGDKKGVPVGVMLIALLCVLGLTSCKGVSRTQARQLVERYNTLVSEAYRRGDVKLVDSVVGPNEGRKLTGLIGVRLDMGISLDSKMLSLEVLDAKQTKDELRVRTRERWSYCDRRIGTGEQVGEKSEDAYEMNYFFKRLEKNWLVDRIEFAIPPKFEHPPATWAVAHSQMSGNNHEKSGKKEVATP